MNRGAWWATVHRVTKSRTQLKRLSRGLFPTNKSLRIHKSHRAHANMFKVLVPNYSFFISSQNLPWLVIIEEYLDYKPFSTRQTNEMNIRPGPPSLKKKKKTTRRQVTINVSRFHENVGFSHHILDMILDYTTYGDAATVGELCTVENGHPAAGEVLRRSVS